MKRLDPLIVCILAAVGLAIAFPSDAQFFGIIANLGIALLFYLYGARLSTTEALQGLKHWKLHATILAFTFVLYPIIGIALRPISAWVGEDIYLGILYLCLVPSTVQSSVAFTSIAKGNVAGAIVSASLSNLVGVLATPILVMALMNRAAAIDASVFLEISTLLLAPFLVGQLTRKWTAPIAQSKVTKIVDRGSIALVVYTAFSEGMINGVWSSVKLTHLLFLVAFAIVLVASMLWLTKVTGRRLGFALSDTRAIQFCGSKKSLATGLPMAAVIFGGGVGVFILPLMIYHQVQLLMCSWYAAKVSS